MGADTTCCCISCVYHLVCIQIIVISIAAKFDSQNNETLLSTEGFFFYDFTSGEVTKACVAGFASFLPVKFLL